MGCNNCYVPSTTVFSNVYIREVIREEIISASDTLKGDSAYEVAVKLGYKGNEEEWLSEQGATIEQINVTTGAAGTNASVVLNGTPKNRRIDLTIPRGDKGIQGEKGEVGPSNYEIAISSGFVGTKTEWLSSIKGEKGDRGIDGIQGEDGKSTYELSVDYGYSGSEREWLSGIINDTELMSNLNADLLSIDEAANGDINTTVVTRTGETYPSAKKAISEGIVALFENGGLPATPFATKALMEASELVDGDYAMVTDDTGNIGLYVKTEGVWSKSSYDPMSLANAYTDDEILKLANKSSGTFDTLALLTASTLTDDSYALVANDTDLTKNGYYKKVSGVWTKVLYDPVAQAKAYTDTIKSETISTANYNALSLTSTIEGLIRELKNRLGVYETFNLFDPNQASAIGRYSSGEPSGGASYTAGLEYMKIEAGVPFWSTVTGGGSLFALYDVNKNYLGSVSTSDGVNGVYPIPKLIDNKIPYFLRASALANIFANIQVGVGDIRPPSNLAYKESYKTIMHQEFMDEIAQDSVIKATIENIATQVHNTPAPSSINMFLKQL